MSRPVALLAYQEADIENQQIEAAYRTTDNRGKERKVNALASGADEGRDKLR